MCIIVDEVMETMKATEIVKGIMEQQGIGQTALGKRIGVRNDAIYQRLKQDNIGVDRLVQMLNALDYKLVIVPSNKQVREGEYEVDMK